MPDGVTKKVVPEGPRTERTEAQLEQREQRTITHGERPVREEVPLAGVPPVSVPVPTVVMPLKKSLLLADIENVLEEGLVQFYKELTPRQKSQFKTEGERTARKIEELLRRAKVAVIEIIRLIRSWLRMIPGVNVFFLEQEAKIKAERIIALKKK